MRTPRLTILSCLLTACAAGAPPTPDPLRVPPPPNLTAQPDPLPQPASGKPKDLEANHRDVARAYFRLAGRFCGLLAFYQVMPDGCVPYLFTDSEPPHE
ncbi:hypothetical protein EM868_00375 [Cupriavidus gilardii]|nr:hypothetical protein [Cupriavidus gilardii]